jgi:crotonobetainyl-CoA:carnitine CoA-transferase CaiB-like acyl-CoA transferase
VPTWFSRTPGKVAGPAPGLGADTEAVLEELGLDDSARAEIEDSGGNRQDAIKDPTVGASEPV